MDGGGAAHVGEEDTMVCGEETAQLQERCEFGVAGAEDDDGGLSVNGEFLIAEDVTEGGENHCDVYDTTEWWKKGRMRDEKAT